MKLILVEDAPVPTPITGIEDVQALIAAASSPPDESERVADLDALVYHLGPAVLRPAELLRSALERAWADEARRPLILRAAQVYADEVATAERSLAEEKKTSCSRSSEAS